MSQCCSAFKGIKFLVLIFFYQDLPTQLLRIDAFHTVCSHSSSFKSFCFELFKSYTYFAFVREFIIFFVFFLRKFSPSSSAVAVLSFLFSVMEKDSDAAWHYLFNINTHKTCQKFIPLLLTYARNLCVNMKMNEKFSSTVKIDCIVKCMCICMCLC